MTEAKPANHPIDAGLKGLRGIARDTDARWLIYSIAHSGEFALWWKPDARGYTTNLEEAGRYTESDAKGHEAGAQGFVRAVSPEEASKLYTRLVAPVEENFKLLTGRDHK